MAWSDPPEVRFAEKLEKNLTELENLDIVGLDEVIFEIRNLGKEGFYKRLINAIKLKKKIYASGAKYSREEGRQIKLLILAHDILSNSTLYIPSKMDLIHFDHFYTTYVFLERIYYMCSGQKLEREDLLNINFSGLTEKIMFDLDNFDKIKKTPEINEQFFLKLKELKWQDNESEEIYKNLTDSMFFVSETIFGSGFFGGTPGGFTGTEMFFTLFLAGCSAINRGRDEINQFDIVRAYKTYFKLLKTDITIYKADSNLAHDSGFILSETKGAGYLVCDKCNSYYKLESGEAADDFEDTCECGGHLVYKDSI
ncbi:MAG: hypothetical protein Q7U35_00265 [Methanobacteriaceae archaeon]|nr:hypothetical protein [Methanobacteriaceae archaeon]MDP2836288.1 hypothetical protein [Methanobacteriaceae archaeon]MDP3486016.1 hypothetical protein [Methanobacteriaceae archaeon]MDP3624918.1 hypothetical protein [Methanobacteriaceae archaeon]